MGTEKDGHTRDQKTIKITVLYVKVRARYRAPTSPILFSSPFGVMSAYI
jgi:hypothetical protein